MMFTRRLDLEVLLGEGRNGEPGAKSGEKEGNHGFHG
jgi:hypothetical protein